ncbi:MAG: 3-dehydroquinate synthase [Cyanothece sp. SIO1E1]|nr:3-dehydroquinate synthase [Cyanothece sp. SIO1E1]
MKSVIPVELPQAAYDIVVATDGLDHLGTWLANCQRQRSGVGQKVLLVSNPEIFRHYGERAIASLRQAEFQVRHCILPAGEPYKTLSSVQQIYDLALEQRLERASIMVALGGGVIGDMTGFAAATWLRGISVVQVPTSLLAMVDAAIGGKTGVNHPQGKNLIGAFHQPRLVLIDSKVLSTLPEREFRAGMAEVIKYGVIWDRDLFTQLETAQRLDRQHELGDNLLQTILTRSAQAKAQVVSQDEREAGLRAILNYGHTIGHAVESLTGYRTINHGEAVAIGMVVAGQIAVELELWDPNSAQRQLNLIEKANLPTQLPADLDIDAILAALQIDKKVQAGRVRFVLPTQIGAAIVTDQVPTAVIRQALKRM